MIASDLAREARQLLGHRSTADKVAAAVAPATERRLLRAGVAAGATVVAVSAASAVTSAIRRRVEGS
jgi:hypothetical protein